MLPSSRTYAFWLALLRIYVGAFWLEHGLGKLLGHPAFGAPDGFLPQYLSQQIPKVAGPYHDFLVNVVQPNVQTFGFLVEFGELAVGALLVLGLFTRVGGFVGVVLALNYFASKGQLTGLSSYAGLDILTAAVTAINVVLPTGSFLGLDAFGARRRRPVAAPVRAPSGPPPIIVPPSPPRGPA
jgi:uncharacterized membrane protein YphA (DoxX/SURF4 family)